MKTVDFFDLFPEEVELIKRHFGGHETLEEIAEVSGQELNIVKRTEASIIVKLSNGLRNCGVQVHGTELRVILSTGLIELKGVMEKGQHDKNN